MPDTDPIALGVASADFDGHVDDSGRLIYDGTRGWFISTTTGDAIFHPPHDSEAFRFVTPAVPVVRHYGAVGVA